MEKKLYKSQLHLLQIELVKLQRHFIECNNKILIILEGRDAAGKDGLIKRVIAHLSPRETRVVALGKPSDKEQSSWYFQRFVPYLPGASELVLFNRSWYNRAGVEHVMGFCTDEQYDEFFGSVVEFEHMLIRSGISLFKYYLDISLDEQSQRLEARKIDPLKQWKISPIDDQALAYWDEYSQARDTMLTRTHDEISPWSVVQADSKKEARVHVISDILKRLDYQEKDTSVLLPNSHIVRRYNPEKPEHNGLSI
jgi:polyphosphate kinase 2